MANSGAWKVVGNSHTSPKDSKQGAICYADNFKLKDLPEIMDKKGWTVSAKLMRKWLQNGAYTISEEEKVGNTDARSYPKHLVDSSAVTMQWALSFERIKKEYGSIFGTQSFFKSTPPIYESPRARIQLINRLAKAGKFSGHFERFGNLKDSAINLNEEWQFQRHIVDDNSAYAKAWTNDTVKSDPQLDDAWGALARFTLKIAGEGTVTPKLLKKKGKEEGKQEKVEIEYYEISVQKIGVYVRDTYDFNGEQYLGHWSKKTEPYIRVYQLSYSSGMRGTRGDCPDDFVVVDNAAFSKHRQLTGKGGDLLVFSDVLVTTLKTPFTFKVRPHEIPKL